MLLRKFILLCLFSLIFLFTLTITESKADLPGVSFLKRAFEEGSFRKWQGYSHVVCFANSDDAYLLKAAPDKKSDTVKTFHIKYFRGILDKSTMSFKVSDSKAMLKMLNNYLDSTIFLVSSSGYMDEYPGPTQCSPGFVKQNNFIELFTGWDVESKAWLNLDSKGVNVYKADHRLFIPLGEVPAYSLNTKLDRRGLPAGIASAEKNGKFFNIKDLMVDALRGDVDRGIYIRPLPDTIVYPGEPRFVPEDWVYTHKGYVNIKKNKDDFFVFKWRYGVGD